MCGCSSVGVCEREGCVWCGEVCGWVSVYVDQTLIFRLLWRVRLSDKKHFIGNNRKLFQLDGISRLSIFPKF